VEGLAVDPAFWSGKRVLVTGHTGFKGGWLCLWLRELGAEVAGFSRGVPTVPSLWEAIGLAADMESLEGDIRSPEQIAAAVAKARPDVLVHMAAQPIVRRSFRDPIETYATNVMGTAHTLEAVRSCDSVRAIVSVTTDKCYENREWIWPYREVDGLGGHDPYSSSKGCAEIVTSAYRRSFFEQAGVGIASARAGNVIGGGDWAEDRLVPDVMRSALDGGTLAIRNPNAVRPWQHVLNPLAGYLRLVERMWEAPAELSGPYNFGPGEHDVQPVHWIIERLTEAWGEPIPWEADPGEHPHEATFLKLDSSKAHTELGWLPRWDLGEALDRIAAWYRALRDGGDMREVALGEIRAYQTGEG